MAGRKRRRKAVTWFGSDVSFLQQKSKRPSEGRAFPSSAPKEHRLAPVGHSGPWSLERAFRDLTGTFSQISGDLRERSPRPIVS